MNQFISEKDIYKYWNQRYNSVPTRVDPVNSWGKHTILLFGAGGATYYWDFYSELLALAGSMVYDQLTAPAYIGTLDYMIRNNNGPGLTGDCSVELGQKAIEQVDYSSNFYILSNLILHRFANGTSTGDPFPAGPDQSLYFPAESSFGYFLGTTISVTAAAAAGAVIDCELYFAFRGYRIFLT